MLKSKKVTIPIIVLSIIMIVISSMILKNKEQEYQKIVNDNKNFLKGVKLVIFFEKC